MRVAVASDERTALTEAVVAALREMGHEVQLSGPLAGGEEEWAEVSADLGRQVAEAGCERGVLFCWSGTGASIAANKVPGVRAALCADAETARMARRYNHANVLVMSLRATSEPVGREILQAFLDEPAGEDDFDRRNVAAVEALDRRS
jgi:RpiB/LacA/LacB family sugar-phosphate isomerase